MKKILSIEEQIEYLEKKKKIIFDSKEEKDDAYKFLLKFNYLNVISLKYLFASSEENKLDDKGNKRYIHIYNLPTKFQDIKNKYYELLHLENFLREGVLAYETELKVYLVLFIKKYLEKNKISFKEFISNLNDYKGENQELNLIEIFDKEWQFQIRDSSKERYSTWDDYYYLLIKILSFGKIVNLLDYKYKDNKDSLFVQFRIFLMKKDFSIGNKIKTLKTIRILRNSLCHKDSLVTFLDKGWKKDKGSENKYSNFLLSRIQVIQKIYKYYIEEIKNEKLNINSENWIKNFSGYRVGNKKKRLFSEICINPKN